MRPWAAVRARTRDEAGRFEQALRDPRAAQQAQLGEILAANAGSAIGRRHGFARIQDADEFRARVPVHRYRDLADGIRATCEHGQAGQLVTAPVLLCEHTSGSGAAPRLIPYTAAMLAAFQRALFPWLHDLTHRWPAVRRGRAYFALSPALRAPSRTGAGIPLGADSDAVYFGDGLAAALGALGVVPPGIAQVTGLEAWRYLTLRYLLDADDLSLISVWSPSFFTTVLDGLGPLADDLARDIERGTARAPHGLDVGIHFAPRPRRAREVRAALAGPLADTRRLWPRLTLLSCWTHGSAARFVPALARALPGAAIQGKGLLATEGVVSLPFGGNAFPVLAVNSGFFEFLDERGRSLLAHELQPDETYQVLLTTHGGLYRYDLGDQVRVRGYAAATPTLEFLGRRDNVSDLCGEKISERQVQDGLAGSDGFALLAPSPGDRPRYRLVVDAAERDAAAARRLARRLDCRLRANPHYDYARRLGQLGPILAAPRQRPLAAYLDHLASRGRRLGDIKPPVLYRHPDWERIFEVN